MSATLNPEIYRSILESLPTAVYVVDSARRILLWNDGAEHLTGYLRQEVIGRSCRDDLLLHCDENEACLCGVACPLQQTMHDGKARTADLYLLHKDGQRVPVKVHAIPLRDEHGNIIGAVESFDRRLMLPTADPSLLHLSQHASADALTGLPDHGATLLRLRAYLQDYKTSEVPFGVLSISVDSLDQLRHADGRNAVNKVLYATSKTIEGAMGPNDMIGRWSEERFLAVVAGCTAPALLRAANTIKHLVDLEGVPWWGGRLRVTISLGGTVVRAGDTPETLVRRSDAALECSLLQPADSIAVA